MGSRLRLLPLPIYKYARAADLRLPISETRVAGGSTCRAAAPLVVTGRYGVDFMPAHRSIGASATVDQPAITPANWSQPCRRCLPGAVRLASAGALAEALRVHAPPDWKPRSWPPELASMLARGVLCRGRPERLLRAMRDARLGKPVVVAAVGSSLTANLGGAVGMWQDRFSELTYVSPLAGVTENVIVPGWLLPVFEAIAPRARRHAESVLVNVGQAGSPLSAYKMCTRQVLPSRADVIIVDAAAISCPRSDVENVLRRLLALEGSPALLLMNFVRWCDPETGPCDAKCQRQAEHTRLNSNRQLRDDGTCYRPPYLNSSLARAARREAPLLALADHYNLTVLSARAAFSDAVARGVAGFDPRQMTADSLHPKPCTFADLGRGGHGDCRGTLLISSLLVAYVHSVWSDAARAGPRSLAGGAGGHDHPRPLLFAVPCRQRMRGQDLDQACYAWGATRARPPPVVQASGFRYTETDTATAWSSEASKQKPGFTAFVPGSKLIVRLNTSVLCAANGLGQCTVRPARELSAGLTYLSSYGSMGIAAISCEGGCTCERTEIDASRGASSKQQDVSLWNEAGVGSVAMRASERSCDLAVTVLNRTTSGGHKFKLRGVTLHALPRGAHAGSSSCRDR